MQEQIQLQRALEESKQSNPNPDQMTYEELLELGNKLGVVAKGFKNEEIQMIPKRKLNA